MTRVGVRVVRWGRAAGALALALAAVGGVASTAHPARADVDPEPVVLGAVVSLTQSYEVAPVTLTTRSARLIGSPATGLRAEWYEGDSLYYVSFDADPQHPMHTGISPDVVYDRNDGNGFVVTGKNPFEPQHGVLDVRDLATDADGRLTRLDVVFITSATYPTYSAFGEVRLNEPEPSADVSPSALTLRWPVVRRHAAPITARETLTNTSGHRVRLGRATVGHGDSADFRLHRDRCSRRTLPAGGSCTIDVAYAATRGGPRAARLTVPAGRHAVGVSLAGTALMGTSTIVLSGPYAPGRRWTYRHVWADPSPTQPARVGMRWTEDIDPRAPHGLDLTLSGPQPIQGVHPTASSASDYGFWALADYSCGEDSGTMTVHDLETDAVGYPTYVDVDADQVCDGTSFHAKVRWQVRKDRRPPTAPSHLRISGSTARWSHSRSSDYASTIVRVLPDGAPVATAGPVSGYAVSAGRATSARLPALAHGRAYVLVAYTVDRTGNVSRPRTLPFTA